jgi:CRISPR-associated protein Csx3
MVNLLPAIIIGGPPHAGKSVLFSSLTRVLHEQGVAHHAIRACPDGEGNWSQEIDQEMVRLIRIKGQWSNEFLEGICRDLERRHLPLLVDMGGRPDGLQIRILQHCTHSLLLLRADEEDNAQRWRQLVEENGLLPLAQLYSEREGASTLTSIDPLIEGTLTQLERGSLAHGPVFVALVERIVALFTYSQEELEQTKLALAPTELVVNLNTLLKKIAPHASEWKPGMIPMVLDDLPPDTALSVYGKAPHWLYSTLAAYSGKQAFYQFDPRIGWICPPHFQLRTQTSPEVVYTSAVLEHCTKLSIEIVKKHLDYLQANQLSFPPLPHGTGLILDGAMPSWMVTALVRLYKEADMAWIACYQPKLRHAVVVTTQSTAYAPGDLMVMPGR